MHRLLAVLAALVLVLPVWTATAAQLQRNSSVSLDSVRMVTPSVGWAVGGGRNPAILRTVDGGRSWGAVLARGMTPSAAAFVDAQAARVAVPTSLNRRMIRIYRTEDAGAHWRSSPISVPFLSAVTILQLDFPSRSQGWLLVAEAPGMGHLFYALWHSSDGGTHWNKITFDLENQVSSGAFPGCNCLSGNNDGISFPSGGSGWVTGMPFATSPPWFYVTHNSGRTWRAQSLPRAGGYVVQTTHAPVFVGQRTGYLPVQLSPPGSRRFIADVYATRDGGSTWRPTSLISSDEQSTGYAFQFSDSFVAGMQGWITDARHLWHTTDGGRHWQLLHPSGWTGFVTQIQFLGGNVGFALSGSSTGGASGYLLGTDDAGRSWHRISR